ncbi:ankyrin repeat domain-containing protein [Zobellia sp. 1_MG-2023]|uniref:ankyrin repeat domain-containing protein n=1 Tax=Zobellia sp. 1_MG-2023 TaxID=3062626 RepID=UPI0026E15489|nr:ankyrin repeat domain-containing protein [Zobellia sp. 1_MG-2023]MDO6818882.1 ankyrin repeat domain-containing protein [Zobellia sp. 1_MG-2023]
MNRKQEIYYSVKDGNLKELETLMKEERNVFDVRPYSQSLLLHACLYEQTEIASYLIKRGFDVNEKDNDGFTPLHACAENHLVKLAELLLQNGADVDIKDSFGNTPLLKAILHADINIDVIKVLLDYSADPEVKNKFGSTALSLALKIKNNTLLKLFNTKK